MRKNLNKIPYIEITKMNSAPRNTLVLITAKISKPFEIFEENTWVMVKTLAIKMSNISNEKMPDTEVIMKNQNVRPAVTATDLKRGDDNSILYRIDKSHQTRLSQCSNSN